MSFLRMVSGAVKGTGDVQLENFGPRESAWKVGMKWEVTLSPLQGKEHNTDIM